MIKELKPALSMLIVSSVVTGLAYPLLVTGFAWALFPHQAQGSFVEQEGKPVASELIGQPFADPKHFWSRASGTSPYPYNASSSGGTNQGPGNPALTDAVTARIKALKDAEPDNKLAIPVDLVTASASGLDPHISPAAAQYQIERVAKARNMDVAKVRELVAKHTEGRQLGFFGEARINVVELNIDLDALR